MHLGLIVLNGIKTAFRWCGINWEPLTAIAAISASVWSGYASWQAVSLAQKGIEIAISSQAESIKTSIVSRAPYIDFLIDEGTQAMSLVNSGLGPGRVYYVKLGYDGEITEFKHDDVGFEPTNKLYDYLIRINAKLGLGVLSNKGFDYSSPIRVINQQQSLKLFSLNGVNKDAMPFLNKALPKMSGLVCFTDLTGVYKGVGGFGYVNPIECPPPPVPIVNLN